MAEFLVEVGDVRRFESPRQYKRGRAELLQKNWKTILYLLDEAQFVDADTPPKLVLRMEERLEIFSSNDIPLDGFGTGIDGEKKTKSNLFQTVDKVHDKCRGFFSY